MGFTQGLKKNHMGENFNAKKTFENQGSVGFSLSPYCISVGHMKIMNIIKGSRPTFPRLG